MKKLLVFYFSGTGNTAYVVNNFCSKLIDKNIECKIINIEEYNVDMINAFEFDTCLVAHPIYGSNMPRIMKEFISNNIELFENKDLITLVTQHSFSGDGGSLAARLIKNKKKHIASIHINMPSNISDSTTFIKVKNGTTNNKTILNADNKIDRCIKDIFSGKKINNGKSIFARISGFLGQRIYLNYIFGKRLQKGLKIDKDKCFLCSKCVNSCPMKNIIIKDKIIATNDNCTLCYRCINNCPKKAISLISKRKPIVQYEGIKKQ